MERISCIQKRWTKFSRCKRMDGTDCRHPFLRS
jgi:hypothetical protein